MQNEVIEFIRNRFPNDCRWMTGNCYYFALILKERFGGDICYDLVDGHFTCKIGNRYYDYTGVAKVTKPFPWNEMKDYDELLYNRIIRDCIENTKLPY